LLDLDLKAAEVVVVIVEAPGGGGGRERGKRLAGVWKGKWQTRLILTCPSST
jgi:hypothetical protein